jgi:hypothetical protein
MGRVETLLASVSIDRLRLAEKLASENPKKVT